MTISELETVARALVASPKGILAMDESGPTIHRRFLALDIPQTAEMRRAYRELIVNAPGLGSYINGAILFDETIRQQTSSRVPFVRVLAEQGVMAGIKVDAGLMDLPNTGGEKVTRGLDDLRERLIEYRALGAQFAKWRAVFTVGGGMPSRRAIDANVHALARYAALCQEQGVVPIVEPEVLHDGEHTAHTLEECYDATERVLHALFFALAEQGVVLEAMILKPSMVVPGASSTEAAGAHDVALATLNCLRRCVPPAVAGVAFLSGGQNAESATSNLREINRLAGASAPWPLTFSFSRAIQQPAMETWRGDASQIAGAQAALINRLQVNMQATLAA